MADKENKPSFWEGVKAEWRKIIWPNGEDLAKKTTAVVVVSVILGVIIAILDFLIQHGIDWLISL